MKYNLNIRSTKTLPKIGKIYLKRKKKTRTRTFEQPRKPLGKPQYSISFRDPVDDDPVTQSTLSFDLKDL